MRVPGVATRGTAVWMVRSRKVGRGIRHAPNGGGLGVWRPHRPKGSAASPFALKTRTPGPIRTLEALVTGRIRPELRAGPRSRSLPSNGRRPWDGLGHGDSGRGRPSEPSPCGRAARAPRRSCPCSSAFVPVQLDVGASLCPQRGTERAVEFGATAAPLLGPAAAPLAGRRVQLTELVQSPAAHDPVGANSAAVELIDIDLSR